MEFQTVSHACAAVRNGGVELLIDPWLIGSCYWRSWFNCPEPSRELLLSLRPDVIYLTHLHWDHFHGPSLRRFPRDTRVVVPRLPSTRRMVEDLHWLGFEDVVELGHGQSLAIGGEMTITSFQGGSGADSTLVVSDGKTTLVDANDCPMSGRSLAQIAERFPNVDFVLRSHTSASPIPYCIDDYPQRFSERRPGAEDNEAFAHYAFALNARHAIPFASERCYLHRETLHYNALASDPRQVVDFTNREAERQGARTRALLMPSGSRWSPHSGFHIEAFDHADRERHIALLADKYRDKLEQSYAQDAETELDWEAAEAYFTGLFKSLPRRILIGRLLDFEIAFELAGKATSRLLLDFARRRIIRDPDRIGDVTLVRTPTRVFNDCCRQMMFATWVAAGRLTISVPPGHDLRALQRFLGVLDAYELGQLPWHRNLRARSLEQRVRRFREAVDLATHIYQSRTQKYSRVLDRIRATRA